MGGRCGVDSLRPSPHNGICPKGECMIAVFEIAHNGALVGLNSEYVIKVTEG